MHQVLDVWQLKAIRSSSQVESLNAIAKVVGYHEIFSLAGGSQKQSVASFVEEHSDEVVQKVKTLVDELAAFKRQRTHSNDTQGIQEDAVPYAAVIKERDALKAQIEAILVAEPVAVGANAVVVDISKRSEELRIKLNAIRTETKTRHGIGAFDVGDVMPDINALLFELEQARVRIHRLHVSRDLLLKSENVSLDKIRYLEADNRSLQASYELVAKEKTELVVQTEGLQTKVVKLEGELSNDRGFRSKYENLKEVHDEAFGLLEKAHARIAYLEQEALTTCLERDKARAELGMVQQHATQQEECLKNSEAERIEAEEKVRRLQAETSGRVKVDAKTIDEWVQECKRLELELETSQKVANDLTEKVHTGTIAIRECSELRENLRLERIDFEAYKVKLARERDAARYDLGEACKERDAFVTSSSKANAFAQMWRESFQHARNAIGGLLTEEGPCGFITVDAKIVACRVARIFDAMKDFDGKSGESWTELGHPLEECGGFIYGEYVSDGHGGLKWTTGAVKLRALGEENVRLQKEVEALRKGTNLHLRGPCLDQETAQVHFPAGEWNVDVACKNLTLLASARTETHVYRASLQNLILALGRVFPLSINDAAKNGMGLALYESIRVFDGTKGMIWQMPEGLGQSEGIWMRLVRTESERDHAKLLSKVWSDSFHNLDLSIAYMKERLDRLDRIDILDYLYDILRSMRSYNVETCVPWNCPEQGE
jgi:hypothetical protein